MNSLITIILIAISLSLDAFSLALIYGMLDLGKRKSIITSTVTGIFHFFMPLLGSIIGNIILKRIYFSHNYFISLLFFIIAIEMIISHIKKEKPVILDLLGIIIFSLSVSIDSFLIGIGLNAISNNVILCSFIFMITSMFFTYMGLIIGKKVNKLLGSLSSIIAIILLLILSIYYLLF
jgi:putative Mn2+ efflux pump MntP